MTIPQKIIILPQLYANPQENTSFPSLHLFLLFKLHLGQPVPQSAWGPTWLKPPWLPLYPSAASIADIIYVTKPTWQFRSP